MDVKTRDRYEARATIVKAMAHPTRLFIVDKLAQKSMCVAELTDLIGADMSTVSRHLAVLKTAGIVQDRKKGVQVYYRLRMPCILNFFGCVETVIKSTAITQLSLVKK
ncbi:MAG: winged helix-turn-helix transcriptional regulator [candidate division Zixibacteria bacterium]|nr:winged helix-turn-helix transcriptional regulator [candidate division Zixibacteria bacterium]